MTLTAALAPLADDLTSFAIREQAFAEMLANARKFDGSYERAKARFDAAAPQQENAS